MIRSRRSVVLCLALAVTALACDAIATAVTQSGSSENAAEFERDVLTLVNEHRAAGATCGDSLFPSAPPLSLETALAAAAREHSEDMAANDYFSHTTPDGIGASQRIRDAGYQGGSPLGENIAAGTDTPLAAVDAWMASTGHCENIMDPEFHETGVGYAFQKGSKWGHYWTQTFGGG